MIVMNTYSFLFAYIKISVPITKHLGVYITITVRSVSVQHMSQSFSPVRMEVVRVFIAVSLAFLVLSVLGEDMTGLSPCDFPAIYNFGDSNSDTGGISAAFYSAGQPSGETFFHQPVGRASDGRLIIDFIGILHFNLFSALQACI